MIITTPTGRIGHALGAGRDQRRHVPPGRDCHFPVITIDVDDIDAALEKIEALGGATVSARQEVGTMGWAAYFRDTEGNIVGLWQNAAPEAARLRRTRGRHRRLKALRLVSGPLRPSHSARTAKRDRQCDG